MAEDENVSLGDAEEDAVGDNGEDAVAECDKRGLALLLPETLGECVADTDAEVLLEIRELAEELDVAVIVRTAVEETVAVTLMAAEREPLAVSEDDLDATEGKELLDATPDALEVAVAVTLTLAELLLQPEAMPDAVLLHDDVSEMEMLSLRVVVVDAQFEADGDADSLREAAGLSVIESALLLERDLTGDTDTEDVPHVVRLGEGETHGEQKLVSVKTGGVGVMRIERLPEMKPVVEMDGDVDRDGRGDIVSEIQADAVRVDDVHEEPEGDSVNATVGDDRPEEHALTEGEREGEPDAEAERVCDFVEEGEPGAENEPLVDDVKETRVDGEKDPLVLWLCDSDGESEGLCEIEGV